MERKGKLSLDFTFDENGEMLESSPVLESSTKRMSLIQLYGGITWHECRSDIDTIDNIEDYISHIEYEIRKLNSVQKIAKLHFIIIPILNFEY